MLDLLGYVKAYKAELKMKDYELYRGAYCSLCRALGRNYSPIAQLFLSYDFTLAALLKLAVSENGCEFSQKRCPYNPAKKCLNCSEKPIFDMCAHAVIITVFYKVLDNISDSKGFKKLGAVLIYPLVALMHRKAAKLAPDIEKTVSAAIDAQNEAEKKENTGIDEAAHPSADALGKIFSGGKADSLYSYGYMVGRFVYILDAADDLESDIKHGCFNPFKKDYSDISDEKIKQEFSARARGMLNLTQSAALEALDEIETRRFADILENITLDGLEASAAGVFDRYDGKTVKTKKFTVK